MKTARFALLCVFAVFALMQAGCRNTWSVNFTTSDESVMDDWGGQSSWTLNDPSGTGLKVDTWNVTSPIGFAADFTLMMELGIDTDASNTADFKIWIGDDDGESPEHYISSEFQQAGDEDYESVLVHEDGVGLDYRDVITREPIPGLWKGINNFRLDKRGNKVTISLNGATISSFDIECYDAPASFVSFATGEYSNIDVYFRKIRVDYEGDPVPLP